MSSLVVRCRSALCKQRLSSTTARVSLPFQQQFNSYANAAQNAKKKKKGGEEAEDGDFDFDRAGYTRDDLIEAAKDFLRAWPGEKMPRTPIQMKRDMELAKAYCRLRLQMKRKQQKEMVIKTKIMTAAMFAIPEPLRREAMKIDWTHFPGGPHPPVTPPIPGYSHSTGETDAA
eukprot:GEZU01044380.1.p1 GENE.GEZU01044380.1~~GEZU01044380.1.p1  ORF type:complete len:173 (+),score=41.43 GEZU01044380.1:27-545(+)